MPLNQLLLLGLVGAAQQLQQCLPLLWLVGRVGAQKRSIPLLLLLLLLLLVVVLVVVVLLQ